MTDEGEEARELEILRELMAEDDADLEGLQQLMEEGDEALTRPYRDRMDALRAAGEDEEAIYHALFRMTERRGDDYAEVFAILYPDGSVLGPSEAL